MISHEPEIRKSICVAHDAENPSNGTSFVITYGNIAIKARNQPPQRFNRSEVL